MTKTVTEPKSKIESLIERVGNRGLTTTQRMTSVEQVLKSCAPQMMAALPKHITPDRMISVAMNCIRKTPKLLGCNPPSLFSAIREAAAYGWELGGVMGHAYLVPYGDECVMIPGYKGLIDLARRTGTVSTIQMEVVHEGDCFEYELGDKPRINHIPNDADKQRDSKPITHVYARVTLRDGGVQRSVWTTARIEAHKVKYSQGWKWAESGDKPKGGGKKDSPWHLHWPVQAKKTVLKDMFGRGLIPLSAELRDMVAREDRIVESEGFDFSSMIESVPPERIENAPGGLVDTREKARAPVADATMSEPDKFRAEASECDTAPAVKTLEKNWLDENSTRELTPEDVDAIKCIAAERIEQLKGGKK